METPKASIIKLNPDCMGTHYLQAEIEELEKLAMSASLWQEKFENAAQANASLEGKLEKASEALKMMYDDGMCWDSIDEEDCNECGWCKTKQALDFLDEDTRKKN